MDHYRIPPAMAYQYMTIILLCMSLDTIPLKITMITFFQVFPGCAIEVDQFLLIYLKWKKLFETLLIHQRDW
jgi:hypothetical protein